MEIDNAINLGGSTDYGNSDAKLNKVYDGCSRCLVLQGKCALLESDIGKKNTLIKGLEDKILIMDSKSLEMKDAVRVVKQRNQELEKGIVDEKERVVELMIENKVVECEKNKAASEVEAWKTKFKELEMRVMQLEKSLPIDLMKTADTTPIDPTLSKPGVKEGRQPFGIKSMVKKSLDFTVNEGSHLQISPSTPAGRSLVGPINISDSDDDLHPAHKGGKKVQWSADFGLGTSPGGKETTLIEGDTSVAQHRTHEKEGLNSCTKRALFVPNPKRRKVGRRVSYIVSSDSECECQLRSNPWVTGTTDNLSNLKSVASSSEDRSKELPARRRLKRVGYCENKSISGKYSHKSIENQSDAGECEIEEDDSSSESETLGGFIVNDSDVSSESEPTLYSDGLSEDHVSENVGMGYSEILSDLQRGRKDKMKWVNEGEMLADFGKHPELCMKAVCALYRQQTSEEKSFKATIHRNGRGFSQIDASMGSALAEFLTDGDPQSDMRKSVEELKNFDRNGIDKCWKLAAHYSTQLFEIYQNNEDSHFHP